MCGICGHLMDQTPIASAPIAPRPVEATPVMATPVTATVVPGGVPVTPTGLPVNPAIASPYAKPVAGAAKEYDPSLGVPVKITEPTTGRSVGAWIAAVGVGMFFALIWGVVASFTGVGGQVFAWAIGAIVGCIAGLIAKNPSIPFCLATTAGALLAMLFGRLVSAWVIMLAVSGMNSIQQFGSYFIKDTGVTIGVMEEMVANGELKGEEKEVAEMKVEAFFSNQEIHAIDEYDNVSDEAEFELDRKVREAVKEMTDEQKQAMLKKVRNEHPEWMEHEWHFEVVLDSMIESKEIEDAGLLDHAYSKMAAIEGDYDEEYFKNTTEQQMDEREEKLREMVMKKYVAMDDQEKLDAIKQARLNHLKWAPVYHEYLAMLDAMYATDDIPDELKETAKSTINLDLKQNYDDAYDFGEDFDFEKIEEMKHKLIAVVNKELLKLEQDEVDKMVAAAQDKYPYWKPFDAFEGLDEFTDGLDDTIASFESDGTFWSSLKTRFKMLDFVWLTLGMISAFAIVFTLGQSGKKSRQNE